MTFNEHQWISMNIDIKSIFRLCLLIRAGKVVFLDKLRPASTVHNAKCLMNAETFQWTIQHASVQSSFSIALATDLLPDTGCARKHAARHGYCQNTTSRWGWKVRACWILSKLPSTAGLTCEFVSQETGWATDQYKQCKHDQQPQQHQNRNHKKILQSWQIPANIGKLPVVPHKAVAEVSE